MKHCLLITIYKNVAVCNHLLETMPEGWGAFVHIDAKCSINPEDINPRAVAFKRYRVYWGAVEHLKAFLLLMKAACQSAADYDYYHLISGEDYWAMNPSRFDDCLKEGLSYMEVHPLPRPGWHNGGYDILKYRTLSSKGDIRKGVLSLKNKGLKLWQMVSRSQNSLPPYPLYCGSVYCTLYKDAVQEVLEGSLAGDLMERLAGTCLGEEVFFQTIIMNSPLKDTVVNNCPRYMDWNTVPAPKYLEADDFNSITSSLYLFCRKLGDVLLAYLLDSKLDIKTS